MTHRDGFPRFSARSVRRGDAGHREACATPSESLGKPPLVVHAALRSASESLADAPHRRRLPSCPIANHLAWAKKSRMDDPYRSLSPLLGILPTGGFPPLRWPGSGQAPHRFHGGGRQSVAHRGHHFRRAGDRRREIADVIVVAVQAAVTGFGRGMALGANLALDRSEITNEFLRVPILERV